MSADGSPIRPGGERRAQSLFHRDIARRALIESVLKLDPRVQIRNPVMFVVEVGAVITTATWLIQVFGGGPLGGGHEPAWYTFVISVWLWLTVVFANLAEAFAEGRGSRPGGHAALDAQGDRGEASRRHHQDGLRARPRGRGRGRGRRADPGGRDGDRRDRLGRRVRDHRRVGASDPRVGRRPQRGDRRHAGALRPDRDRDHAGAGTLVPGSDDRAGRGGRAAQDPERDRPEHPARGAHAGVHRGGGDAPTVRPVRAYRRSRRPR